MKKLVRVKPGFIGRQGSSDRSFYVSFTDLLIDTYLERSYPFVFATNLLSDTALKICIARVIRLCSHWIKASSEKTRLCCSGVSIIFESEKIVTRWPTSDLIALTQKGSRGVGAQPPLLNKQNVKLLSYVINCAR